jgi:Uma2 family endonuclease
MTYIPEQNPIVPDYLIYEELNGIPVYYRGYKEVINQGKKLEDITGYGALQWYLLTIISDFLKVAISKKYFVLVGEGGLHLEQKNNLSLDVSIYLRNQLSFEKLENKYLDTPPKVVIEIDTKADPDIFNYSNYFAPKTQALLDFGVEQVIWVYTNPKKVTIAQPTGPWLTVNWTDEITVLGQTFTIQKIIDEAEVENTAAQ